MRWRKITPCFWIEQKAVTWKFIRCNLWHSDIIFFALYSQFRSNEMRDNYNDDIEFFTEVTHTHKQNKSIRFDRIRTCRMNFDWIRTFFFVYNHTRNRFFIHLVQMCTYFLKFDKIENYFETGKQRSDWSKFESSAFLHNCSIWRLFATTKRIASHIKSIQSTNLCIFQCSKDIRSKYSQRKYWKSDPRDSQY